MILTKIKWSTKNVNIVNHSDSKVILVWYNLNIFWKLTPDLVVIKFLWLVQMQSEELMSPILVSGSKTSYGYNRHKISYNQTTKNMILGLHITLL